MYPHPTYPFVCGQLAFHYLFGNPIFSCVFIRPWNIAPAVLCNELNMKRTAGKLVQNLLLSDKQVALYGHLLLQETQTYQLVIEVGLYLRVQWLPMDEPIAITAKGSTPRRE